jgi:hypothetical protein
MSFVGGTPKNFRSSGEKNLHGPELKPLEVNGITAVTLGTIIWLLVLVVLLLARNWLDENSRTHWIWIAGSGVVLGLLGYRYTTNRVKRLGLSRDDFIFRKFDKREPDQYRLIQDFE